jgi:crotonobetainyl-CoA:carnitine CoA-transferase CaiB-like acyl-CoA transferase
VPCGPINRLDEVFADPQVRHRGLRIDLPHPRPAACPSVANPIRLSAQRTCCISCAFSDPLLFSSSLVRNAA